MVVGGGEVGIAEGAGVTVVAAAIKTAIIMVGNCNCTSEKMRIMTAMIATIHLIVVALGKLEREKR